MTVQTINDEVSVHFDDVQLLLSTDDAKELATALVRKAFDIEAERRGAD